MILLVMVALMLTLDFARGGFPAAEPSFRAGLGEDWRIYVLSVDSTRAVSKKAADSGFFRPRMILLVMVALMLTLDYCSGASPPAALFTVCSLQLKN